MEDIRLKVLESLGNPHYLKVFFNNETMRLKKNAFLKIRKHFDFIELVFKNNNLKTKDLVILSNNINNLFYIDSKNEKIFTLDIDFANWCRLTGCQLLSIRSY